MLPARRQPRIVTSLVRASWWGLIIWTVVFWRLGYPSLLDPDEAHYAQITREMLSARDWLVPLLTGRPFIDKPVLFHWVQGLSFAVFGMTELAARIPSALAALSLTWTTYWLGRELFDQETGERAAAMLLTMPATFALASLGLFDMVFTAFLFGSVACLVVAAVHRRTHLQWAGYGLLSLAILTKGPVAALLLGVAFAGAMICVRSARKDLGRLRWIVGPLVAMAIATPWFAWMWWKFGAEFTRRYVVEGNVWYVTHPYPFRQPNYSFYARTYFGAFIPWSLLSLGRVVDFVRTRGRTADRGELLLWAWAVAVLGVFTLARFKLDTYIYPVAPVVCLVAARAWAAARDSAEPALWQRVAIVALPIVLATGAAALGMSMFDLDLRISRAAILLPIGVVVGAAAFGAQVRAAGWRPPRAPLVLVATLLVVYASVVLFGFPVLERVRPTKAVGQWISDHQDASAPVGVFQLEEWEASLRFYSGRRIERLDDEAALRTFLEDGEPRSVVMLRRKYRAMREMGLPLRLAFGRDAVIGRSGTGLRRQRWGRLVVVTAQNSMRPVSDESVDGGP